MSNRFSKTMELPPMPDEAEQRTCHPPERPSKPRPKKSKKAKPSVLGRTIAVLLTVVLVVFVGYSAFALYAIGRRQYDNSAVSTASIARYAPEDVRTYLLVGTDERGTETGRADTIMLLSISKQNKTITLTSIMRDTYVGEVNPQLVRINEAYFRGGVDLLAQTISQTYGMQIDGYVKVNFRAFVNIVDALGGVTITLSDREAEAVNLILQSEVNALMGDATTADQLSGGGTLLLNGKQALSYARIRKVGNADFERTQRQRLVLTQLLDRMKAHPFQALPAIARDVLPELTTDLSSVTLYGLSLELPHLLTSYEWQTLRLPADGTYSGFTTSGGAQVLRVDFAENLKLFQAALEQPPQFTADTIAP